MSYKVLIIGLGSIAQKHIHALKEIDPEVNLIAFRSRKGANTQEGIHNVFVIEEVPEDIDFVIVSNPTSEHAKTIESLIDHNITVPIFIEKPPFHTLEGIESLFDKVEKHGIKTYTAFNFRFHPLLQWLKKNIRDKRVLEVQAYCGSYLPDWRPGRDYRNVYSAHKDLGGGVHLDLIHEMDYMVWLFGRPMNMHSHFSKKSDLEIDSIDCAHYWLEYEYFNAGITLNYYRPHPKRQLEIVFKNEIWFADLIQGIVTDQEDAQLFKTSCKVQYTYEEQMQYFLSHLNDSVPYMNDVFESLETLKITLSEKNNYGPNTE